MLLQYRGVKYQQASPGVPRETEKATLTYRGVTYQPDWSLVPATSATLCYRGLPYTLNGKTAVAKESDLSDLLSVVLLKETNHFTM